MKILLLILLAFIVSFGLWYLAGAFIANSWNIMNWMNLGKIIYLLFSIVSFANLMQDID